MAKKNGSISYRCSNCNYSQPRWLGRCPECGEWNSFEEVILDKNSISSLGKGSEYQEKQKPVELSKVISQNSSRILTGINEFDRVLGGGATKRSGILIGGEPGIGKSTLLLQTSASALQNNQGVVLYVSGEESLMQIKERAERLQIDCTNIQLLSTSRLEDVLDAMDSLKPLLVIIDSIQTIYSVQAGIIPSTVNQLKFCSNELISWVKQRDSVLIMTAHVTKDGSIAGPKALEHMVDTVISFERNNDDIRFLHAQKNRFGSIDELGIFSMDEKGLSCVQDPSSLFLTKRSNTQNAGVICTPVFEGSRVFMVEIQALTVNAKASLSRIYSEKIDSGRIARIAAIIEKRCGLVFSDQDIYINVAGGIKLNESSIDSAIAVALYSARTDIPIQNNVAVFGELSLAGEVRTVPKVKQRIKACSSLGFNHVLCPEDDNDCTKIDSIKQLVRVIFSK